MNAAMAITVLKALYKFVRPLIEKAVKDSKSEIDDFMLDVFDKIGPIAFHLASPHNSGL